MEVLVINGRHFNYILEKLVFFHPDILARGAKQSFGNIRGAGQDELP